jgi:hypothetical protein
MWIVCRVSRYGSCGDPVHKHVLKANTQRHVELVHMHSNQTKEEEEQNGTLGLIGKYKFYLAFENSIQPGYVTEKLFEALGRGAIPVYLGAPDAPRIVDKKAYIDVLDFENPWELAHHMVQVAKQKELFME